MARIAGASASGQAARTAARTRCRVSSLMGRTVWAAWTGWKWRADIVMGNLGWVWNGIKVRGLTALWGGRAGRFRWLRLRQRLGLLPL